MIVKFTSKKDPDDKNSFVESEASRRARQRHLEGRNHKLPADVQARSDEIDAKRVERLDDYFSHHPPNGPMISIFREALEAFVNTNGETPLWLTYPRLFACFDRLESAGVLKIEMTEDKFNARHYKSTSTANRRNVRPAELDVLIATLKKDLGEALQQPAITLDIVRGCRQITVDRWRVSLYFGGYQRALGCYPFETAVRLQDVLAYYFSTYRRPAHYNISEDNAKELLTAHPALATFCIELEKLWLAAGVLVAPGAAPVDRFETVEQRLTAVESALAEIKLSLDELRKLVQVPTT